MYCHDRGKERQIVGFNTDRGKERQIVGFNIDRGVRRDKSYVLI